jgi:serine/threonine protein kinase
MTAKGCATPTACGQFEVAFHMDSIGQGMDGRLYHCRHVGDDQWTLVCKVFVDGGTSRRVWEGDVVPEAERMVHVGLSPTGGGGDGGKEGTVPLRRRPTMCVGYSDMGFVPREIRMYRTLPPHRNILRLEAVSTVPTSRHLSHPCMVMPKFAMDLVEHVRGGVGGRLTEDRAKEVFADVATAVQHMHNHDVAHLDIKPDNVLLDTESCRAVLADLGAAQDCRRNEFYTVTCGTPGYNPPELKTLDCKQVRCFSADIWSLGTLLYCMFTGCLLTLNDDLVEFRKASASGRRGKLVRPSIRLDMYLRNLRPSEELLNLLDAMLQEEPSKRVTIADVCAHPWLTKGCGHP